MKPSVLYAAMALGLAGVATLQPQGTAQTYETLVKDMLGTVENLTKLLVAIENRDTAAAAKPELKKNAEKLLVLRKQAEDWKQPNKEERDRLEKEYAPKLKVAVEKFREQVVRIESIPGCEEALAELAILKDKSDKDKDKDKDKKDTKKGVSKRR